MSDNQRDVVAILHIEPHAFTAPLAALEAAEEAERAQAVAAAEARGYDRAVANGRIVLADREKELLDLKGPCSNGRCRLHYAHSGPCDIRTPRPVKETPDVA